MLKKICNFLATRIIKKRGICGMRYEITYYQGKCVNYANSRVDLLKWLKVLKDEEINDIKKIYRDGRIVSVYCKYKNKKRKVK